MLQELKARLALADRDVTAFSTVLSSPCLKPGPQGNAETGALQGWACLTTCHSILKFTAGKV